MKYVKTNRQDLRANQTIYKDISRTTLLIVYSWLKEGQTLDFIVSQLKRDKKDIIIAHQIAKRTGVTKSIMEDYYTQQKYVVNLK